MSDLARLSQEYRDYARFEMATHGSPIYAAICCGVADDPDVGGIGLLARPGFRTPLAFVAELRRLASDFARPVWLIACEGQSVTASLALGIAAAPAEGSGFSVLTLHRFAARGGSEHRLLAECHAQGRWIRWLDPGTAAAA